MDTRSNFAKLITLEDFLLISTRVFNLFGLKMTNYENGPKPSTLIFRKFSLFCVITLSLQTYIFILVHLGEKGMFLISTYNLSCIGFGFILALKVYMIGVRHHDILLEVIGRLDAIVPKSNHEQAKSGLRKYLRTSNFQNGIFSVSMLVLFAYFNLSDIMISVFKFFFIDGIYDRNFTMFMWFPFDYDGKSPVVFEIFYGISVWCGFTCLTINLAFDLIYCSLLSILCMKFEVLKSKLEEVGPETTREDLTVLIKQHTELIR